MKIDNALQVLSEPWEPGRGAAVVMNVTCVGKKMSGSAELMFL